MLRPGRPGSCGANREALSPVNTRSRDFPSIELGLPWNTSNPNGCIMLRELVCMNTLAVAWFVCLFRALSSSWAEVPSKSPRSFRYNLSPFLCTEILKFLAMMHSPCCLRLFSSSFQQWSSLEHTAGYQAELPRNLPLLKIN